MQIIRTASFKKDFEGLPTDIKRRTEKVLILLATNPFSPLSPFVAYQKDQGRNYKRIQRCL